MSKQDIEREYNAFNVEEKESGKKLYEVYGKFHGQYASAFSIDWDKLDIKFKITWTRTAKAVKYAI